MRSQWDNKPWDSRKKESEKPERIKQPKDPEIPDRMKEEPVNVCEQCKHNPELPLHRCRYQMRINNDFDFRCNCCDDCRQICIDSV